MQTNEYNLGSEINKRQTLKFSLDSVSHMISTLIGEIPLQPVSGCMESFSSLSSVTSLWVVTVSSLEYVTL